MQPLIRKNSSSIIVFFITDVGKDGSQSAIAGIGNKVLES